MKLLNALMGWAGFSNFFPLPFSAVTRIGRLSIRTIYFDGVFFFVEYQRNKKYTGMPGGGVQNSFDTIGRKFETLDTIRVLKTSTASR